MSQTITLAQLRAEVGYAADVTVGEDRYPNAMINGWVNQAIQNYQILRRQNRTSDVKIAMVTSTASTTPGDGGWPANQTLFLPDDIQSLVSVYYVSGSTRVQLTAMASSDNYNDLIPVSAVPTQYSIINSTTAEDARLRLWPPASGTYTFEVVYTPEPTTLSSDIDSWDYAPGTLDVVVCEVALKVLDRDGVPEPQQYQALQNRKLAAEQALKRFSIRDPGVLTMRNTRAINESSRRRNPFR